MISPASVASADAVAAPQTSCHNVALPVSPARYGTLQFCHGRRGGAPYYLHRPPGNIEGAPVLVSVHGISRNAGQHARAFGSQAARLGFVTVAPRFAHPDFPGYQRLGHCRDGRQSSPEAALEEILDEVKTATGADTSRVFLFGFSGGAQFAHRFALCRPHRVRALVLGSAGWYTFPDTGQPFPRGLGPAPLSSGLDLLHFLRIPVLVTVGDRDTRRDGAFNASRKLDLQQGRNRVERGQHWVAAMREAAQRVGIEGRFSFRVLHTCGHNFRQCVEKGALVPIALEFFLQSSRRPLVDARLERASPLLFSTGTGD